MEVALYRDACLHGTLDLKKMVAQVADTTPIADAAVTVSAYDGYEGEAMALGERPPLALLNAAASARMAVSSWSALNRPKTSSVAVIKPIGSA